MDYPLISEYVEAIKAVEDNFEQLKHLRPVLSEDGAPVMTSGGFAVVFKMKDEQTGKFHAVKCFLKDQEGRAEAYRMIAEELEFVNSTFLTPIKYLDKELFVDTSQTDDETEFPVLLMDWVEGVTLDKYIRENIYDEYALSMLAYQFSRLAMWMIPQPFAHGDLKPDNILVKNDGSLVLVDYDGMYVPTMKGQNARELGSPDFRHPCRTETDFDEHIDDFSLASILLSLKAIALQPERLDEYGASDRLLFSEKDYRNVSQCELLKALLPSDDSELNVLTSLFMIALEKKNLSNVSFRLFNLSRPNKSTSLQEIRAYCSVDAKDIKGHDVDKYGAIYSHDHKILLRLPYDVIEYNIEDGTEIIANGSFDHFEVVADSDSVDIFEARLEKIYFPASIRFVTDLAFGEDGRKLKEIGVASYPSYYKSLLMQFSDKIIQRGPYEEVRTHSTSLFDIAGAEYSPDGQNLISLHNLSPDIHTYQVKRSVRTIGFGAAQLAKSIHEIIIPQGVEKIEGAAFRCSSLSNIKLPASLKEIGYSAFEGCHELQKIDIPEGVEIIERWAFINCKKLESVTLPSSLLNIKFRAFAVNKSLKTIRFNGFPSFESDCFDGCSSLEIIYVPKGAKSIFEIILPLYKNIIVEDDVFRVIE